MNGLTNTYVLNLCRKLKLPVVGVFSCDQIEKVPVNKFAIINLDKSYNKGTHFVVIWNKNSTFHYFDPLGFQCYNEDVIDFFLKNNKSITFNSIPYQSVNSTFCGYFCVAYIINNSSDKHVSLESIMSRQLAKNDQNVVNFIVDYIKTKL